MDDEGITSALIRALRAGRSAPCEARGACSASGVTRRGDRVAPRPVRPGTAHRRGLLTPGLPDRHGGEIPAHDGSSVDRNPHAGPAAWTARERRAAACGCWCRGRGGHRRLPDRIRGAETRSTRGPPTCTSAGCGRSWQPVVNPRVAPRPEGADKGPRRPPDQARRGRILGIFDRGATQSGGMHRRSNAAGTFATGCRDRPAAGSRRCSVSATASPRTYDPGLTFPLTVPGPTALMYGNGRRGP